MKPTPLAFLLLFLAAASSAIGAQERIVDYDVRMSLDAKGYLSVDKAVTVDYEHVGMAILGILLFVSFGAGAVYLIFFVLPAHIDLGSGGAGGGGGGGGG